jgi:hypothetical protein
MNRTLLWAALAGALSIAMRAQPAPTFAIAPANAAPTELSFGGTALPLVKDGGGFQVEDFNAHRLVDLAGGALRPSGAGQIFTAKGSDVALHAEFTPAGDCVRVTGEIESLRPTERALIVRYLVPFRPEHPVFQDDLGKAGAAGQRGTIFPLASLTGKDGGVALEIPPTCPCCFGLLATPQGLTVEFYLGVSPATKAFPNRAAFSFLIDAAEANWGFRSALTRYYHRYPDFYRPRYRQSGFWNWNDPAGFDGQAPPVVDAALPMWLAHGLTRGANYDRQIAHDQKFGVQSFTYTITGMRELVGLPDLPADYDDAMKQFSDFGKAWAAEGAAGPLHHKYTASNERNRDLPAQILNSTVGNADGHLRIRTRNTVWGANSITFVENPNPDLFLDRHVPTVGSVTLALVDDWFAHSPAPGIHLDSLGSQWPSCVNYRQDHFTYARFPLTFDKNGRVALHNMISHYELIDRIRERALAAHKLIFGNGFDIYESRRMEEHYNGLKNGRFFLAAQVDVGGREIEDDLMSRERLEAFRTCFGPKVMTAVLYRWTDPDVVHLQMNRALAFDVFAAPNRFFGDKISYLSAPNGLARDKEFLEWFTRNAKLLHAAGWQPVTHAVASSADVVCERYGSGDTVYFAVENFGTVPTDTEVTIDLGALELSPRDGAMSYFTEIARKAPVKVVTEGDFAHLKLHLVPNEANIVKLSRAW